MCPPTRFYYISLFSFFLSSLHLFFFRFILAQRVRQSRNFHIRKGTTRKKKKTERKRILSYSGHQSIKPGHQRGGGGWRGRRAFLAILSHVILACCLSIDIEIDGEEKAVPFHLVCVFNSAIGTRVISIFISFFFFFVKECCIISFSLWIIITQ